MTLFHCPELRELEFSGLLPTEKLQATVSSITSVNFRKITFSQPSVFDSFWALINHLGWRSFDDCVCALADKLRGLGNIQLLEIEFQINYLGLESLANYTFLPKFREKGRLKVVECSSGWSWSLQFVLFSHSHRVISDLDLSEMNWIRSMSLLAPNPH
jgi:hypothetical protein